MQITQVFDPSPSVTLRKLHAMRNYSTADGAIDNDLDDVDDVEDAEDDSADSFEEDTVSGSDDFGFDDDDDDEFQDDDVSEEDEDEEDDDVPSVDSALGGDADLDYGYDDEEEEL